MGGDFNFSLGLLEFRGPHDRVDPLIDYFTQKLADKNQINVEPSKLKLTWRNKRVREDQVTKRIDKFVMSENFVERQVLIKQWIGTGGESDHFPIFLEVRKGNLKLIIPFKFNSTWLEDPDFNSLVRASLDEMRNWSDSSSLL